MAASSNTSAVPTFSARWSNGSATPYIATPILPMPWPSSRSVTLPLVPQRIMSSTKISSEGTPLIARPSFPSFTNQYITLNSYPITHG
uniref:Uncharacterized protein n=1 Tax=Panagrellus redivivus TaxID=6233 RepID=A0A7E4UNM7_PANRE